MRSVKISNCGDDMRFPFNLHVSALPNVFQTKRFTFNCNRSNLSPSTPTRSLGTLSGFAALKRDSFAQSIRFYETIPTTVGSSFKIPKPILQFEGRHFLISKCTLTVVAGISGIANPSVSIRKIPGRTLFETLTAFSGLLSYG
jgi:hypothetical protein